MTGPVEELICTKAGNLHTLKRASWFITSFLHISKVALYCSCSLPATLRMTVALVRTKLLSVNSVQAAVREQEPAHCLFSIYHFMCLETRSLYSALWHYEMCIFLPSQMQKDIIMATLSTISLQVCRSKKQAINNVLYFLSEYKNNFCSVLLNVGHTWQLLTCTVFNICLANGRQCKIFCWNI